MAKISIPPYDLHRSSEPLELGEWECPGCFRRSFSSAHCNYCLIDSPWGCECEIKHSRWPEDFSAEIERRKIK